MLPTSTSSAVALRPLVDRYVSHAEQRYRRRSGEPTGEHANIKASLNRFVAYAGDDADAVRINRHQVRAWVDQLAAEELARSYVNACLQRLRRFVNWAADLDYIPMDRVSELRLVRPLAPLRSRAREPEPRKPPPLDHVAKILPFLPPMARDVCKLSTLTAARPSELLELTNAEVHIDQAPRLTPLQHKCAHHGKQRVIPLCPAAVAIITSIWRPLCPGDALFPSPRARRRHYHINSYRSAIARACKRAGVEIFVPYDVRHAVARHVRKQRGLDAAQALLGHSNASTTEIYAPLEAGDTATFRAALGATEVL